MKRAARFLARLVFLCAVVAAFAVCLGYFAVPLAVFLCIAAGVAVFRG